MNKWIRNAIFYHIYPLGFCGAPKKNEGEVVNRIKKIIDWIPHLKKLYVNALYLGPLFESSEHGYDTKDYLKVDKRLGTNDDLKIVCDRLHENNIKVIFDGVFNHVGREFFAFKDLKINKENSKYRYWFENIDFSKTSPMGDSFCYEGWNGHYNLVKLNIRNIEVQNYLFNVVRQWIEEFDIDGLRLDAADYMDRNFFKQLSLYCKSQKHDFWLMGEVIHGDYNLWANKDMLDSTTNYECYKGLYSSLNEKNYFEIAYSINRQYGDYAIYKDLCLYNFVDNHDVTRVASILRKKEYLKNIYTLLYTMPGIPSIYYGSEWGLEGVKGKNSDDELRPNINIKDMNMNYDLLKHIKKLGKIRSEEKALIYGGFKQVLVKNEQLVIQRFYEDESIYVALNLSENSSTLIFRVNEVGEFHDLLDSKDMVKSEGENINIELNPYSSCILKRKIQNNVK